MCALVELLVCLGLLLSCQTVSTDMASERKVIGWRVETQGREGGLLFGEEITMTTLTNLENRLIMYPFQPKRPY